MPVLRHKASLPRVVLDPYLHVFPWGSVTAYLVTSASESYCFFPTDFKAKHFNVDKLLFVLTSGLTTIHPCLRTPPPGLGIKKEYLKMEDLHAHCLNCINRRCMTRPETGVSCDLIGCHLVCGAVFHACKAEEHCLLCPLERVPCLNVGFGCPFTIPRMKMAEHLETCPASVVCCTMEWNRWPVSYSDRQSYENLSKDFDEVEQLDMALALQDQRMLLESQIGRASCRERV